MKILRLFVIILVLINSTMLKADRQGNTMILSSETVIVGELVTVALEIENVDEFVGFELEIPLPPGFEFDPDSDDSFVLDPNRANGHTPFVDLVGNTVRLGAFALPTTPFLGDEGAVAYIQLTVPDVLGTYTLEILEPKLSDATGNPLVLSIVNGVIDVQPDVVIPGINTISLSSDRVLAGQDATIVLSVENEDLFAGLEIQIPLPPGFEFDVNDEDAVILNFDRIDGHEAITVVDDGTLTIYLANLTGSKNFLGNEGPIAYITLQTPDVPGFYDIIIQNPKLSDLNGDPVTVTQTFDGEVELVGNIMRILNADVIIDQHVMIEIEIENFMDFVGFQTNVVIPDGFVFNDGLPVNLYRNDDHLLEVTQNGNVLDVLAYSPTNKYFLDTNDTWENDDLSNELVVVSFWITAPSVGGIFEIELDDSKISDLFGNQIITDALNGFITVYDGNVMYVDNATGATNQVKTLDLVLDNNNLVYGFQAKIDLDGLQFVPGSVSVTDRVIDGVHDVAGNLDPDGNLIIVGTSIPTTAFPGFRGAIATFDVLLPNDPGVHELVLDPAATHISSAIGTQIPIDLEIGTVTVEIENELILVDAEACSGLPFTVDLILNNNQAVAAFQTDIAIPDGYEFISAELNPNLATASHIANFAPDAPGPDNVLTLVVFATPSAYLLNAGEGEENWMVRLHLLAPSLADTGTPLSDITVSNSLLSDTVGNPVIVSDEIDATITLFEEPAVLFALNNEIVVEGAIFDDYCFDTPVSATLYEVLSGVEPFYIKYKFNGAEHERFDVFAGDVIFNTDDYPLGAGTYQIEVLELVDANGCSPVDMTVYQAAVVINPEPTLTIQASAFEFDYFGTVEIDIAGDAGAAPWTFSYNITGPEGLVLDGVLSGDQVTVVFELNGNYVPGIYTFQITDLIDDNGCEATAELLADFPYVFTFEIISPLDQLNAAQTAEEVKHILETYAQFFGIDVLAGSDYYNLAEGRKLSLAQDILDNRPLDGYADTESVKLLFDLLVVFRTSTQLAVDAANAGGLTIMLLQDVQDALTDLIGYIINGEEVLADDLDLSQAFIDNLAAMLPGRFAALVADLADNGPYASFTGMSEMLYPLAQFRFATADAVDAANDGSFTKQTLDPVLAALQFIASVKEDATINGHPVQPIILEKADFIAQMNMIDDAFFPAVASDLQDNSGSGYTSYTAMSNTLVEIVGTQLTLQTSLYAVNNANDASELIDFEFFTIVIENLENVNYATINGVAIADILEELYMREELFNALAANHKALVLQALIDGGPYVNWTEMSDALLVYLLAQSTYAFDFDLPADVCPHSVVLTEVTFMTDVAGVYGYNNVRFKIDATGPGDVHFSATDSAGNLIEFVNNGFWGPASGFELPAVYEATTEWSLLFTQGGDYEITFSLIDAPDGDIIADFTETVEIEVFDEPLLQFAVNGNAIAEGHVENLIYGDDLEVSFLDAITGEYPFAISWTVNGDADHVFAGNLVEITGPGQVLFPLNAQVLNAGQYDIQVTYILDGNGCSAADISIYHSTINIAPKTLTVLAHAQTKVYGETDPAFTFTATGFAYDEDESIISGTLIRELGEDVGTYAIELGTLSAGDNYVIDYTGANLEITPATLTVVAHDQTKVYGEADPEFTYTAMEFAFDDDESIFTGALTRDAGENVGVYAINIGSLSAGINYIIDFTSADLTITKADLFVTADPQSKIYGEADPELTFTVTGYQFDDDETIFTGDLDREAGEDVGVYEINIGTLEAGINYDIVFTPANLEILVKELFIVGTFTAFDKVYDTTKDAEIDLDNLILAGIVGDDDVYLQDLVVEFEDPNVGEDIPVLIVDAAIAGTSIHNYVLITDVNENIMQINSFLSETGDIATIEVEVLNHEEFVGFSLDIPLPDGFNFIDGSVELFRNTNHDILTGVEPDNTAKFIAFSITNDPFVGNYGKLFSFDVELPAGGGEFPLELVSAILGSADALNILDKTVDGVAKVVEPIEPGIDNIMAINPVLATVGNIITVEVEIFNSEDFVGFNLDIPLPDGFTYIPESVQLYRTVDHDVMFNVVEENNLAKIIAFSITNTPFEGNEGVILSFDLATTAEAGDFDLPITTAVIGNASAQNIIDDTVDGTVKLVSLLGLPMTTANITPKTLSVVADEGQNKVYGEDDPLPFTYEATGFAGDEGLEVMTGELEREAGEDVGLYAINIGTLSAGDNYEIEYTGADFEITPATLFVVADAQTKVYGETDPELTFTVTGFQFGDNESLITGELSRDPGENVGVYPITLGSLAAGDNYVIDYTGADLVITKADLFVFADPQTKVYGETDPELTYTVTGFQFNDGETLITGALDRDPGENVGAYAINIGSLDAGINYEIDFTSADLEITKADLFVIANPQTKVYGEADPVLTYSATGFQFDDDETVFTGELERDPGEEVGFYDINIGSLAAGINYDIDFTSAQLEILQKNVFISGTFTAFDKEYDATVQATIDEFNLTLIGVIGDDDVELDNVIIEFEDPNTGEDKLVSIVQADIIGADAHNYVLFMDRIVNSNMNRTDENTILIHDISAQAGDIITVEIEIINYEEFVGFSVDVPLPDGFDYIDDSVQLFRKTNHDVVFNVIEDTNLAKMIAFSISNDAFIGNDGVILSFDLQTPSTGGVYTLELVNPVVGNASAQDILDVAINGTLVLDDPGAPSNIMFINDITALPGSIITVEIEVQNDEEFAGFSVDVPLPEGFDFVEDSEQLFRGTNHGFVFNVIEGNVAKIIAFSITNDSFIGNDGVIFSFDLQTPDDLTGVFALELVNPVLGNADAVDILTGYFGGTLILDQIIELPTALADIFHKEISIGGSFTAFDKVYDGTVDAEIDQNNLELVGVIGDEDVDLDNVVVEFAQADAGNDILVSIVEAELVGADIFNYVLTLDGAPTTLADILATLTLIANPEEGGTVTGAGVYNFGDMVDVDAIPNEGWEFINWTDVDGNEVSDVPANTIEITGDLTIIANFEMIDYTLTLIANPAAGGVVTGGGVYNFGDMVDVDAIPNEGWAFVNWTDVDGNEVSDMPANTITMPSADLTLTANFEMIDYTLTLIANPATGGVVTGAGVYNFGDEVDVDAIPNEGWAFVNWTDVDGNEVSDMPANTITMPSADLTLTANFVMIDYTLTLIANPATGGVVTGAGVYNFGDEVDVDAIPNATWAFVNWTDVDGNEVSGVPANTITMPAADLTLIANFELVEFEVTFHVVEDSADEAPIGGAVINIAGVNDVLTTDANGMASIMLLVGDYTADITADHYEDIVNLSFSVVDQAQDIMVRMTDIIVEPFNLAVFNEGYGFGEALFTWNDGLHQYRYDSGIVNGQLGFQGNINSVLGSAYHYDGELKEIIWWLTSEEGTHASVKVWILGLDEFGYPDKNNILYTNDAVPNVDNMWNKYELSSPVTAPNGFFIGLSYNGYLSLATDDGLSNDWPFNNKTQFTIFDITTDSQFIPLENDGFTVNFLLRAYGYKYGSVDFDKNQETISSVTPPVFIPLSEPFITEDMLSYNYPKSFVGFDVFLNGNQVADEIAATDYMFKDLEVGFYTAGVRSVYTTGMSDIITIDFEIPARTFRVTFNVVDQEGEFLDHAIVTLDGIQNPTGNYTFDGILAGTYSFKVEKAGYFTVEGDVTVADESIFITVEMIVDDTSIISPDDDINLSLYPNPARNILTIESNYAITAVRMIDMLGQLVYDVNVDDLRHEIDVNAFNNGIYFVQISTSRGIYTHRIQVAD